MSETKPRPLAWATEDVVDAIAYRLYLRRLEPPMTPEESASASLTRRDNKGNPFVQDDESRRRNSRIYASLVRDTLHALADMGIIAP